jgi:hypothetical protein
MKDRITLQKMEQERRQLFLGCDAHRKYSVFVTVDERGKASAPVRVEHDRPSPSLFGRPAALKSTSTLKYGRDRSCTPASVLIPMKIGGKGTE